MGGHNQTCSTGCRPRLALALLGQPTKTEAFADLAALSSPIQQPTPPILVQLPVKKREAQVQVLLCNYFLLHKTRLLIDLNHCEYIFLRTSSAQDLNSFSLFTKHGHGKRGVLENKSKRATRKHLNFGGKTSTH